MLHYSIGQTTGRTGHWTTEEDNKLKDAVQLHGGKNWDGITALVPGRTRVQCQSSWHSAADPRIVPTSARSTTGK
eukprot:scaffold41423_cov34-Attheya_sp.AAC.3